MLHAIAHERKLAIPELSLPGEPKMWEMVRRSSASPPEPPEHLLKTFALQLSRRNPKDPPLSVQDPTDREKLKNLFLEANPDWHRRMPGPNFRGGKKSGS